MNGRINDVAGRLTFYGYGVQELAISLDDLARRTGFSGVVRIDDRSGPRLTRAYGLADRRHGVPATIDTRFAIASGVKGLTALTVIALVDRGDLTLQTPARAVLGDDLPMIDDAVTVEHLLAHRSGIGDYLDEDSNLAVDDYLLPVPVHELATTEQYLPVLAGHPQKFPPGQQFSYCNSGFVVLALIAQRRGGAPFAELIRELVCVPAGMAHTRFLRSDDLPGDAATGYLAADHPRTNVFHLPVVGSGDGGIYSTVGDVHAFWDALDHGRIVPQARVAEMLRPRSEVASESKRYGLGFWLHATGPAVMLEGMDAGVSFQSRHDPGAGLTWTVMGNTTNGAWPIVRHLTETLS